MRRLAPVALMLMLACGGGRRPGAPLARDSAALAHSDSLVLRAPAGREVWFTASRADSGRAGEVCTERALEIRAGGIRTPVPLLYTAVAPTLANDTTARAELWKNCRAGDRYDVDLRTGQPVRVRP